ncbi:MAG: tripartite tricarboxylate transporter substrate binding protein [Bacillota bacterium]
MVKKLITRSRLTAISAGVCVFLAVAVLALGCKSETFPDKPITMIIPFSAGGANDMMSRPMVPLAKEILGQPLNVTLMPGASGVTGTAAVLQKPADGYTVLFVTEGPMTVLPIVQQVPYKRSDFTPICRLNTSGMVIVTGKSSPWKTFNEAVEAIRKEPGKYAFATAGLYSTPHMAMLALENEFGLSFKHVPFDGGGAANVAVASGDCHLGAPNLSVAQALLKSGDLKPLAVTSEKRMPELPDVPTIKELGAKVSVEPWRGIFVKAGTPDNIVKILRDRFGKLLNDKRYVQELEKLGERLDYLDGPDFQRAWDEGFKYWSDVLSAQKK